MLFCHDQLNRIFEIGSGPLRFVSLVPSQTELLYDLGLNEEVVGITKYCVYPAEWFLSKPHVGGTKTISIEKIKKLKPDLIIANKEENTKELIEKLEKSFAVWVSDIKTLNEALEMIIMLGEIAGKASEACAIATEINKAFDRLEAILNNTSINKTAAYLIWRKPYMVAGTDTFVNDMMQRCGLTNAFATKQRYPEVSSHDLHLTNPDVILLSSEPYPFREKHINEFKAICPEAKIVTVNGEFFSWYGSRLKMAPAYFISLLHELNTIN